MNYNNPYHSDFLNRHFSISNTSVDYYNDYNIGFEFKESFKKDTNKIRYNIHKHQLLESKYVVFCIRHERFYILKSNFLLKNYKVNEKYQIIFVRISFIIKFSIFKTNSIKKLKNYIDNLKK